MPTVSPCFSISTTDSNNEVVAYFPAQPHPQAGVSIAEEPAVREEVVDRQGNEDGPDGLVMFEDEDPIVEPSLQSEHYGLSTSRVRLDDVADIPLLTAASPPPTMICNTPLLSPKRDPCSTAHGQNQAESGAGPSQLRNVNPCHVTPRRTPRLANLHLSGVLLGC